MKSIRNYLLVTAAVAAPFVYMAVKALELIREAQGA